jgi:hypothetical protein
MDFSHRIGALLAVALVTTPIVVHAQGHLAPGSSATDWQIKRLMAPTPSQLASESKGHVFIYDSLEIGQVDAAMDHGFDRIENMMFIRIHHPPDTEGGKVEVGDDDC